MKPPLADIWDTAERPIVTALVTLAKVPDDLGNQPWQRIAWKHQERLQQEWAKLDLSKIEPERQDLPVDRAP